MSGQLRACLSVFHSSTLRPSNGSISTELGQVQGAETVSISAVKHRSLVPGPRDVSFLPFLIRDLYVCAFQNLYGFSWIVHDCFWVDEILRAKIFGLMFSTLEHGGMRE